uniref:Polyprenol monophosphomannose synthase n=1 Tax=Candidatus Methanomethylicus mesodigestus TaxID=1867258 RepID=A0A7C3J4X1_9CREN
MVLSEDASSELMQGDATTIPSSENVLDGVDKKATISIILPTFNEAENVPRLIGSIFSVLASAEFEIVVIDDGSPDGTADLCQGIGMACGKIKVIVRDGKKGLASAIIDGIREASSDHVVVMDADFQHPTEILPFLYAEKENGYDILIGSRYVDGAVVKDWGFARKLISRGAIRMAHWFLPKTRGVRDPISGLFMIKKRVIEGVDFDLIGYKILLEILTKGNYCVVREVPYTFSSRRGGKSKISIGEIYNYCKLVYRLSKQQAALKQKGNRKP